MKNLFILIFFFTASQAFAQQTFEYYQMTTVESVVPGGLGRSRLIMTDPNGKMEEIKMENFFSMVGINFENIRSNDQLISDKINDLAREGWELSNVSAGAYGHEQSTGIFITRYMFKRALKENK
jgi:hypothetical protein